MEHIIPSKSQLKVLFTNEFDQTLSSIQDIRDLEVASAP